MIGNEFVCESTESANNYIFHQSEKWLPTAKSLWSDSKSVWDDANLKDIHDDLRKFFTLFCKIVESHPSHQDAKEQEERQKRPELEEYAREFMDNASTVLEGDGVACAMGFINYHRENNANGICLWLADNGGDRETLRFFTSVEYKLLRLENMENKKYIIDVQQTPILARRLKHQDDANDPQLLDLVHRIDPTLENNKYKLIKLPTWSSCDNRYRISYSTGPSSLLLSMEFGDKALEDGIIRFQYHESSSRAFDFPTFEVPFTLPFLSSEFFSGLKINERKPLENLTGHCQSSPFSSAAPGNQSRGLDHKLFYQMFIELIAENDEKYYVNLILCGIFASKVNRGQSTNPEVLDEEKPWPIEEDFLINWLKTINPDFKTPKILGKFLSNYSLSIAPERSTAGRWTISYDKSNGKPKLEPPCCAEHEQSGAYPLSMSVEPYQWNPITFDSNISIGKNERLDLFENCEINSKILAKVGEEIKWSPLNERSRLLLMWLCQFASEVKDSPMASRMEQFHIGLLSSLDIVSSSLQSLLFVNIQKDDPKDYDRFWLLNLEELSRIVGDFFQAFLDHLENDKIITQMDEIGEYQNEIKRLREINVKKKPPSWISSFSLSLKPYEFLKNTRKQFKKEMKDWEQFIKTSTDKCKRLVISLLLPLLASVSHMTLVIFDEVRNGLPFSSLLLKWGHDKLSQHMCRVVGGGEGPHCEMVIYSILRLNLDIEANKLQSIGISKECCALCNHVLTSFGFKNYRSGKDGKLLFQENLYDGWRVLKWMVEGDNLHTFLGGNSPNPEIKENSKELLRIYKHLETKEIHLNRSVSIKSASNSQLVLRGSEVTLILLSMLGSIANDLKLKIQC